MRLGSCSPAVAAATVVRSEGQRMLNCVSGSLAAIASELGCKSPQTVQSWRVGAKMPSAGARARMQEAFGIPQRAWSMRPGGPLEALADASVQQLVDVTGGGQPSTLEDCLALLTVIRRDRMQQGLMPSERVKLADAEARILGLRARLEEAAQFAEAKYVTTHPSWLKLKRAILRALEPHAVALRAVAEAIEAIES